MIYIDNLCEFVRMVIENGLRGILTPQNKELVSTADLVREIAKANGRRVIFTSIFNWAIRPGSKIVNSVKKAFADDCYDLSLSDYCDFSYCKVSFADSIKITERR